GWANCPGTDRRAGRELRRRSDQDAVYCEQGSLWLLRRRELRIADFGTAGRRRRARESAEGSLGKGGRPNAQNPTSNSVTFREQATQLPVSDESQSWQRSCQELNVSRSQQLDLSE